MVRVETHGVGRAKRWEGCLWRELSQGDGVVGQAAEHPVARSQRDGGSAGAWQHCSHSPREVGRGAQAVPGSLLCHLQCCTISWSLNSLPELAVHLKSRKSVF